MAERARDNWYTAKRGAAAVHAVVAALLTRGSVPALPVADVEGVDLVVGAQTVQVKAVHTGRRDRMPRTVLTANKRPLSRARVYVFVSPDNSIFWIARRECVEAAAGKGANRHVAMRSEWQDQWGLLA